MAHRRPATRARKLLVLLLALALCAPGLPAVAQSSAEPDNAIVPINLEFVLGEIEDEGRNWVDQEGVHTRNALVRATVAGDIVGEAEALSDFDSFGTCDAPLNCSGEQQVFAELRITSDEQIWTGSIALEISGATRATVHGILVGRHGASDQVIVLDTVIGFDGDSFHLNGNRVTLTGPIGGVHISGSACVTGPTTADGAFIGTSGVVVDGGPLRVGRQTLGGSAPSGIYGETLNIGQKGNLRGLFIAGLNDNYAHGSFVLIGESGPYAGMLGYGRATETIVDEPRCASGLEVNSTWTGQVRYDTDPRGFLTPRVYFVMPEDRSTVSSPITMEFGAEHVMIEPATGVARDGAGHLTLIVDAPCIGPGEPMPQDELHIQLVEGQTTGSLSLLSGQHRLCLQLTDGGGIAQPATDVITIFVAAAEAPLSGFSE